MSVDQYITIAILVLTFASILGGTCTLIGISTNLVVTGMVIDFLARGDANAPPLRQIAMFDLAWIGLPATAAGIVFLMLISRFLKLQLFYRNW